jgi:DNA-binding response OmpR family regulator
VLIFDDDDLLRRLYRCVLRPMRLLAFSRVEEGLEQIASADLVITDLDMPGMGGRGLLNHLCACNLKVPILVVTGAEDVEVLTGSPTVLKKPFSPAQLRAAVATLLLSSSR